MKTPYRVTKDGREICLSTKSGRVEYRRRTMLMFDRQEGLCALCEMPMSQWDITFDHEHGRGMGGSNRDDRIEANGRRINAAVHSLCNYSKGSKRVPYMVQ